jgi:hypothetical protein
MPSGQGTTRGSDNVYYVSFLQCASRNADISTVFSHTSGDRSEAFFRNSSQKHPWFKNGLLAAASEAAD